MRTSAALKPTESVPISLQPLRHPDAGPRRVSRTWVAQQVGSIGARRFGRTLSAIVLAGGFVRGESTDIHTLRQRIVLGDTEIVLVLAPRAAAPARKALARMRAEAEAWLEQHGIACSLRLRTARQARA